MGQIKIITDSTSDLTPALIKEFNINVIPLKVQIGDNLYREGVDITPSKFYELLAKSDKMPTTSQPSPGEFMELYQELTADGSSVISIHISSQMSGTVQAANLAQKSLPDRDITVVDSRVVCMALGLVVLAAARAAREGQSKEQILARIQEVASKVQTYFVVDTLEYLAKGGRIGKAAALLGTVLNIKPILTIDDGMIAPYEKVRGKGKALDHIIELAKGFSQDHKQIRCAMVHGNALEDVIKFDQRVASELNYVENVICEIGAVVGTHCGPGTIALFFYDDSK